MKRLSVREDAINTTIQDTTIVNQLGMLAGTAVRCTFSKD